MFKRLGVLLFGNLGMAIMVDIDAPTLPHPFGPSLGRYALGVMEQLGRGE